MLLPQPSQNKCCYSICADQISFSLTKFVENISDICISNKFIMKIDSTIYLMILIMYYKY
jgi:hypothetical protein